MRRKSAGSSGYREIAAKLRDGWLARAWQGGQRCPSHVELQARFGTTEVTIQRAMALLARQGFIETRPRSGRFLAARPPAEIRYAMVFPGHPDGIHSWLWTRQFLALFVALEACNAGGDVQVMPYFDVAPAAGGAGYQRLCDDVSARCIGGVVFSYTPHELRDTPLLRERSVPMVVPNDMHVPDLAVVGQSGNQDVGTRLVALLRERGCHKVGVLLPAFIPPEPWLGRLQAAGFDCRPVWVQGTEIFEPRWLRHSLRVILDGIPGAAPEALVITDDHLVEATSQALAELNLRTPQNLQVFGHWNFPLHYSGTWPVELVGCDAREVVSASVRAIQCLRRGETLPSGGGQVPSRLAGEFTGAPLPVRYRERTVAEVISQVRHRAANVVH